MKGTIFQLIAFILSIQGFATSAAALEEWRCPPSGPLVPRPSALHDAPAFLAGTRELSRALDDALLQRIKPGFSAQNTSFSLAIVCTDSSQPLWEYHHRGDNANGTARIDGDSQYLIGSISKLFTQALVEQSGIDPETPVSELIPELARESVIDWSRITIASLGEHLSGIPPNYGFGESFFLKDVMVGLGYPNISSTEFASCGVTGLNQGCNEQDFLAAVLSLKPVAAPFTRPIYSNLAFNLLGLAVSRHTGVAFSNLLRQYISQPLGLSNTGVSPGNDTRAVIPPVPNSWGGTYGEDDREAPAGGLFSSSNDLAAFSYSILSDASIFSENYVASSLNPKSATSSPFTLVGKPWEITRTTRLTPDNAHTVDVFSKSGGAHGYASMLSLVPSYGVGFVVLTAGDAQAREILIDAMLGTFVPAIDLVAEEQAMAYSGTYRSKDGNYSLAISSTADGPGLQLDSLQSANQSVLAAFPTLFAAIVQQAIPDSPPYGIFPTSITTNADFDGQNVTVDEWRIHLPVPPAPNDASELPGQGTLQDFCTGWQNEDWLSYGQESLQRLRLWKTPAGEVLGWDVPSLRSGLMAKAE